MQEVKELLYVENPEIDTQKSYWVDLVRLYNSLSLNTEDFHVLLHKANSFIDRYPDMQRIFSGEYLLEMTKITTRFLFSQRLFQECSRLLTHVLAHKPQGPLTEYSFLEKLQDACLRATSGTYQLSEVEEVTRLPFKPTKKKPFETEDVVLEAESRVLTQSEITDKMVNFENLPLQEQIDKADTYLLSFLLTQRNLRSP